MRKLILVFAVLLIVSCKNDTKNYVTLKGRVKTPGLEKIIVQSRNFLKEITVENDGTFSDTLKVTDGIHIVSNGDDRSTLFLKNGYDLNLNFRGEKFSEGILFDGNGSETNTFLDNKRSFYLSDLGDPKTYFKLDKEAYEAKVVEAKSYLKEFKDKAIKLDSTIKSMDTRNDKRFFDYISKNYEANHANLVRFAKGKVSPVFKNYENYKGGTTSLEDFKGKFVYIDVWATWCAPCKAEIPHLKTLENEFHGKNIEFVSISVDKPNAYETWKKMVETENLKGVQLFADNNFDSDFIAEYGINSIPRFILLDPKGNIVDSNADRPSNPKLKELLLELGI